MWTGHNANPNPSPLAQQCDHPMHFLVQSFHEGHVLATNSFPQHASSVSSHTEHGRLVDPLVNLRRWYSWSDGKQIASLHVDVKPVSHRDIVGASSSSSRSSSRKPKRYRTESTRVGNLKHHPNTNICRPDRNGSCKK